MFGKCSPTLQVFRRIICRSLSTCRQISHNATRSHYHHHQYHHKQGRRWWDRRILLAFTSAAGFSFAEHGIPDERYEKIRMEQVFGHEGENNGWEKLVEEKDLKVFRRLVHGPYEMYEYKCIGTYYDISPAMFLDVQNDLEFRSNWDTNVLSLDMLKEEDEHELIRWVQRFPYPLYPREYIYTRRTWISVDTNTVIVDSEVVPTHLIPGRSANVRVATYRSRMAVRAHKEFDERGMDFALTYFDNPEANIPRYVYNWMVNHGGPYFLRQVHDVARQTERSGRKLQWLAGRMDKILRRLKREKPVTVEEVKEEDLEDAIPASSDAEETGSCTNVKEPSSTKETRETISIAETKGSSSAAAIKSPSCSSDTKESGRPSVADPPSEVAATSEKK